METEFSKLNCSYCNKPFTEELWCEKCDPLRIMVEILVYKRYNVSYIKEGGFAKVYSAT
ncbi:hypothetical protein RhiirA1_450704 [Rhizophagus irregularis]|uniref:Uncharacterized protein n=1 Tax=Rhizophagus irregularis TaxID=588596 RepID=A0A2N0SE24_9GLOM|nr:hypothetical protein RhiirA1_450704 [Rhizophagus irregularis]